MADTIKVAELEVTLTLKEKKFNDGLDKATKKGNIFTKGLDKGLNKLGVSASTALTTIVTGLVLFGKESFEASAQAERLLRSTNELAKGLSSTAVWSKNAGDALVSGIQNASLGTIDSLAAMEAANKAMLFGVIESQEDMEKLTVIAQVLGNTMGQDTAKSLDDLTTGLGRQEKEILDNLGLIVSQVTANENWAKANGRLISSLTDEERKLAFIQEALTQGEEAVAALGGQSLDAAGKTEQLSAAWTDFVIQFGKLTSGTIEPLVESTTIWVERLKDGAIFWQNIFEGTESSNVALTEIISSNETYLDLINTQLAKNEEELGLLSTQSLIYHKIVAENKLLVIEQEKIEVLIHSQNKALELQKQIRADNVSIGQSAASAASAAIFSGAIEENQAARDRVAIDENFRATVARGRAGAARANDAVRQEQFNKSIETAEEEAKNLERIAIDGARSASSAIEDQRSEVSGVLSGIIQEGFGALDDLGLDFLGGSQESIGEDARRLAAIAAGDFNGEAASLLRQTRPDIAEIIFSEGIDPAAEAQRILQEFATGSDPLQLINREEALNRARAILLRTDNVQQLVEDLTTQLISEGFNKEQIDKALAAQFGTGATDIQQAVTGAEEIEAIQGISTNITTIGATSEETFQLVAESISITEEPLNILLLQLEEAKNILIEIEMRANGATGGLSAMGSSLGLPSESVPASANASGMRDGGSVVMNGSGAMDSLTMPPIPVSPGEMVTFTPPGGGGSQGGGNASVNVSIPVSIDGQQVGMATAGFVMDMFGNLQQNQIVTGGESQL